MMRSWGNRSDTVVVDEPFYAHYLKHSGVVHPMNDAIIANQEINFDKIVESVCRQPSSGIYYQKHITTHMLPTMPLDWLTELRHAFLIRDPRRVVKSYTKKRSDVSAADLGYEQQQRVFDAIADATGNAAVVIDSDRFLENPEGQLRLVCEKLNVDFESAMLSWAAGARDSDGIWEAHWYDAVKQSTGFQAATPLATHFDKKEQAIVDECLPFYQQFLSLAV